jgi:hypothetical protein
MVSGKMVTARLVGLRLPVAAYPLRQLAKRNGPQCPKSPFSSGHRGMLRATRYSRRPLASGSGADGTRAHCGMTCFATFRSGTFSVPRRVYGHAARRVMQSFKQRGLHWREHGATDSMN